MHDTHTNEAGATPTITGGRLLFVCTGNTCRSPLAEAIAKRLLADALTCPTDELPARGWSIHSAGIMAGAGDAASEYTIQVAHEYGIDLTAHRSTRLNPELLSSSTHVLAVTHNHAEFLRQRFGAYGPLPQLLTGLSGPEIPDPIGGSLEQYRKTATLIEKHLREQLAEWLKT